MPVRTLEISFTVPDRLDRTLPYQRPYLMGLERVGRVRLEGGPAPLRLVRGADRKIELERRLQPLLSRLRAPQASAHVGRYVVSDGRARIRFAIDAHDAREIRDPQALADSDVYFKSNLWPGDVSDPRVLPVVNGNGQLRPRDLAFLRSLRDRPKDLDLVFVSRVWGGREHNLRLFEQAASLDVSNELLAIFPPGTPAADVEAGTRRLAAVGVTASTRDLPPRQLWETLARAKVVLLRAGKYLCIPWRAIDLLCMGACIVVDAPFGPRWPVPLQPGLHYVDCGLERPADTSPAPDDEYPRVAATIARVLADGALQAALREASARYYDEHVAPERVGAYLIETVRSRIR